MKRLLAATAITLVLASAVYAADEPAKEPPAKKDFVMMKVDGDEVKRSEVEATWQSIFPGAHAPDIDSFNPDVRDNVLRGVASERLLLHEAEKTSSADSDAVKKRLQEARNQIVIQEYLKDKSKDLVTEQQIKDAYDQHVKEMGAGGEEAQVRHIMAKSEEQAKTIEKKVRKDEKSAGWSEMGWLTQDRMTDPDFAKAVAGLKKGEISAPVKTAFGWQVIQVENRRKFTPPTFEAMHDKLRQKLQSEVLRAYVEGLLEKSKMTVYDEQGNARELHAHGAPLGSAPQAAPSAGGALSVTPAPAPKQ